MVKVTAHIPLAHIWRMDHQASSLHAALIGPGWVRHTMTCQVGNPSPSGHAAVTTTVPRVGRYACAGIVSPIVRSMPEVGRSPGGRPELTIVIGASLCGYTPRHARRQL